MSLTSYFNPAPLSSKQRGILGGLFKKAYARAATHFATDDMTEEEWRHAQCRRIAGVTIKEAKQKHFNRLRMYGEDLCGNSGKAFAIALQLPEEETRRIRAMVEDAMARRGINWGYITAVVKGKFKGKALDDLSPFEWEQLLFTVNNRGKAIKERKDGEFDGSKRNKKQREKKDRSVDFSPQGSGASVAGASVDSAARQQNEPVTYWEMITGGRAAQ